MYCLVLALLLVSLHLSTGKEYCITPASMDGNSTCVTLSQFVNSDYYLESTITLILQRGNHNLDIEMSVVNIMEFRMINSEGTSSSIVCKGQARILVEKVESALIKSLTFVGCREIVFNEVNNLHIENSVFTSSKNDCTALMLNSTTLTTIARSSFSSNKGGIQQFGQVSSTILATRASQIYIKDSIFQNNHADHKGTVYSELGSTIEFSGCRFLNNQGGAIYAIQGSVISIYDSTFFGNRGKKVIFFDGVIAVLQMTNFTENSEVLLTVSSNITMNDCNFDYNYVPENTYSVGIVIVAGSLIRMKMCSFFANKAIGIVLLNNVTLISEQQLKMYYNEAFEGVIGVLNSAITFLGTVEFENNLGSLAALESKLDFRGDVKFFNNTSSTRDHDTLRGGALTAYNSIVTFLGTTLSFNNNSAMHGGALFAVGSSVYFVSNTINMAHNEAKVYGGGIFVYQTFLYFKSLTTISYNEAEFGGGIYALASQIRVIASPLSTFHSLQFTKNIARRFGGGIYFSSDSYLYVYHFDSRPHHITVVLTANTAEYGGAMYVRDETYTTVCEANSDMEQSSISYCFFQVTDYYRQSGTLELIFDSNQAYAAGSLLYGGLLDRCTLNTVESSFFDSPFLFQQNSSGITYLKSVSNVANTDVIASLPVRVCFCSDDKPNCSLRLLPIQTQKGKNFNVSISALDQVGHPLNATLMVELQLPTEGGLGEGQQSQVVHDRCTDLTFSVTSLSSSETIAIFAIGPCGNVRVSSRQINITFSDCVCPIGFDADLSKPTTCNCICSQDPRLRERISNCSTDTETFLKVDNSWITFDQNSRGFVVSSICPYDYCLEPQSVEVNLNFPNGSDLQCANNRSGKICGACKPQFSLSLGQSGCVKCGRIWPLNVILITIGLLTFDTLLVVIIIFLNLTVTVGTINGFIFSANILRVILPFPHGNYQTYFVSFLNLDVGFNVCYFEGFNAYGKMWFEILAFPFYLLFLIIVIIIASNYSTRFAKFIGKRNVIETLATLVFLTYPKLLQFVIGTFLFATIEYPDNTFEVVWRLDGNIGYFDTKHLVLITVAIIILVPMSIYTFLLLFWQCLVKCPNWKIFALIRNTKLHSFIQMYHIPYNERHRYWTGLLLFIRIVVYVVEVLIGSKDSAVVYVTIIVLLNALFVIKTLHVRIYKNWPIDALESVLIVITIMITVFVWYNRNMSRSHISVAITSISTIIMLVLFIATTLYHINKYVLKIKFGHTFYKQLTARLRINVHQRSHKVTHIQSEIHNQNHQQQETAIDYPGNLQYLDVNRFNSIRRVMDSPTERDYYELYYNQLSEREDAEQVENKHQPPPTFSEV